MFSLSIFLVLIRSLFIRFLFYSRFHSLPQFFYLILFLSNFSDFHCSLFLYIFKPLYTFTLFFLLSLSFSQVAFSLCSYPFSIRLHSLSLSLCNQVLSRFYILLFSVSLFLSDCFNVSAFHLFCLYFYTFSVQLNYLPLPLSNEVLSLFYILLFTVSLFLSNMFLLLLCFYF